MFAPFDQILHRIYIQRRATHGREAGIGADETRWGGKRLYLDCTKTNLHLSKTTLCDW